MTASILARVSGFTNGDWLMTRDTVFFETLARRAMSLMVARRPRGIREARSAAAARGAAMLSGRGRLTGLVLAMVGVRDARGIVLASSRSLAVGGSGQKR